MRFYAMDKQWKLVKVAEVACSTHSRKIDNDWMIGEEKETALRREILAALQKKNNRLEEER